MLRVSKMRPPSIKNPIVFNSLSQYSYYREDTLCLACTFIQFATIEIKHKTPKKNPQYIEDFLDLLMPAKQISVPIETLVYFHKAVHRLDKSLQIESQSKLPIQLRLKLKE